MSKKKKLLEDKNITLPSGLEVTLKFPEVGDILEETPHMKWMREWVEMIKKSKEKKQEHWTEIEGVGKFLNLKPLKKNDVSDPFTVTLQYDKFDNL